MLSLSRGYASSRSEQRLFSSDARVVQSVHGEAWEYLSSFGAELAPISIFPGNPAYIRLLDRAEGTICVSVPIDSNLEVPGDEPDPTFRRVLITVNDMSYGFSFATAAIAQYFSSVLETCIQDAFCRHAALLGSSPNPSIGLRSSSSLLKSKSRKQSRSEKLLSAAPSASSGLASDSESPLSHIRIPIQPFTPVSPPMSVEFAPIPPPIAPLTPKQVALPRASSSSDDLPPSPLSLPSIPTPLPSLDSAIPVPSRSIIYVSSPPLLPDREPQTSSALQAGGALESPAQPILITPSGSNPMKTSATPISTLPPGLNPIPSESSDDQVAPADNPYSTASDSVEITHLQTPEKKRGLRRHSFTFKVTQESGRVDVCGVFPPAPSVHTNTTGAISIPPEASGATSSVLVAAYQDQDPIIATVQPTSAVSLLQGFSENDENYGNTKRQFAILKEMLTVQKSYLKTMMNVEIGLRQPIAQAAVLSNTDLHRMFPRFSELLGLHSEMVAALEARLQEWAISSTVADIWLQFHPRFVQIYPHYCATYLESLESDFLSKMSSKKRTLRTILKNYQVSSGLDKLTVNTHLGQPVQQPPRYVLLLKDMLRSTSDNHPSYALLVEGLDRYLDLAADINSAIQANQNQRLMVEMKQSYQGFDQVGECTLVWAEPITVIGQPSIKLLCLTNRSLFFTSVDTEKSTGLNLFKAAQENFKIEVVLDLLHVWPFSFSEHGTTDRFTIRTPSQSFLVSPKGSKDEVTITKCVDVIQTQLRRYFVEKKFASMVPPTVSPADPLAVRRFSSDFLNGDSYSGWWLDGVPHGEGMYLFSNANQYIGSFLHGKRDGYGRFMWQPSGTYEGEWKKGRPCGRGRLISMRGDVYDGSWDAGEKSGEGSLTWPNGDTYVGTFNGSHFQGHGTLTCALGNFVYTGEFLYSHPHNQGKLTWFGNTYEGQFVSGMRNGNGKLIYANGDTYVGTFLNDAPSGKGKIVRGNGLWTYEGTLVDGVLTGFGKITLQNAFAYEGGIDNGQRNGTGICTYQDGSKYDGQWQNDIYHGSGVFVYSNGSSYDGSWKFGLKQGCGIERLPDGSIYTGEFDANCFHGQGTLTDPKGSFYRGEWSKGRRCGQGEFISFDGSSFYRGGWLDDKRHGEGVNFERGLGTLTAHFKKGYAHGIGKLISADKSFSIECNNWNFNFPTGPSTITRDGVITTTNFVFDPATSRLRSTFEMLNWNMVPMFSLWKR